jgi:translation initiation factor 3 subunit B
VPKDKFHQLLWRPRVPSLLPADKEAEILKNLKSYSKRYDEEDEALLQQADQDVLLERKQLLTDWEGWYESKQVRCRGGRACIAC